MRESGFDSVENSEVTDLIELLILVIVTIISVGMIAYMMNNFNDTTQTVVDKVEVPVTDSVYKSYTDLEYNGFQAYMIAYLSKNKTPNDSRYLYYDFNSGSNVMVDIDSSAVNGEFIVTYSKWLSDNLRPDINGNADKDQELATIRANWYTAGMYALSYNKLLDSSVMTPSNMKYIQTLNDYITSGETKEGRRVLWQIKQN